MKIGIMGGTFNPIHNAHLMMAQAAYEQYKLDEIWFMPSAKPPHKNQDEIAEKYYLKWGSTQSSIRWDELIFPAIEKWSSVKLK